MLWSSNIVGSLKGGVWYMSGFHLGSELLRTACNQRVFSVTITFNHGVQGVWPAHEEL